MTDPNSITARLRFWLSDKLRVHPPPGEAWCVGCSMNGRKTKIVAVNGLNTHLRSHAKTDFVKILTEEGNRQKWHS